MARIRKCTGGCATLSLTLLRRRREVLMNRGQFASIMTVIVVVLSVSPPTGSQPRPSNPLIGTWSLVSIEDHRAPSVLFALGPNPRGIIIYTATGEMAVQIARDPQSKFSSGYERAKPEEIKTAYEGYYAYFGKYDVDFDRKIVTHHVEASLRPMEIGLNYERTFELSGDRLILIPMENGKQEPARLTWRRVQ